MKLRRALPLIGALAVGSTVAGCSGGSSSAAPPTTTSPQPAATVTVTETPTPSASASVTPSASASPSTTTVPSTAAAAACRNGQLTMTLGSGQGAAGSSYQPIIFTNTSSKTCSLTGYPGVSFLDSGGTQLGDPAAHSGASHGSVNLTPAGKASALLRLPDPGVFSPSNCKQTTAAKVKVYPPNQTESLSAADAADICTTKTGRSSIGPVHAGSDG